MYRIKIEQAQPKEGEKYENYVTIYEQLVEDLNLIAVINAVNNQLGSQ